MKTEESHTSHNNSLMDTNELIGLLWGRKKFIAFFSLVVAIFSVFYSLSLPNIYTSEALLSPTNPDESLSSKLGAGSQFAGFAGVYLPGENVLSKEATARIKSFEFFSNHFLPYIKLENMMAVEEWIYESNSIIYNEDLFDAASGKWVRDVQFPLKPAPTEQEAYLRYKSALNLIENKQTSFLRLSMKHQSPYIAQKWVDIIIKNINESMREEKKKTATNAIEFLNISSKSTNVQSLQDVISTLLESQMQTLMLASSNEAFVFKTLDSPIVPERKSDPSRAIICILGTLLGSIFAVTIVLIQHYRKTYNNY